MLKYSDSGLSFQAGGPIFGQFERSPRTNFLNFAFELVEKSKKPSNFNLVANNTLSRERRVFRLLVGLLRNRNRNIKEQNFLSSRQRPSFRIEEAAASVFSCQLLRDSMAGLRTRASVSSLPGLLSSTLPELLPGKQKSFISQDQSQGKALSKTSDSSSLSLEISSLKSMDAIDERSSPASASMNGSSDSASKNGPISVPVFVMLPLDTVTMDGTLKNPRALSISIKALCSAGVTGLMIDVWWGLVEREGPGKYDWTAYLELVQLVKSEGLKLQAVMSFHACGGNVGDDVSVPLPEWVRQAAMADPDVFYADKSGFRNPECISLFADEVPCLLGRTPIQAYADFMAAFRAALGTDFGTVVTEIAIGMGPCGELRYPAYPEGDGRWRFPGIGEFQCYDSRAIADLAQAAAAAGHPDWGLWGPHDAGRYNSRPYDTGFFRDLDGSWNSDYGRFFLSWYSEALLRHGDRVLQAAVSAFRGVPKAPGEGSPAWPLALWPFRPSSEAEAGDRVALSLKCAGVHWWYGSAAHAAELTAGYYNVRGRDGYRGVVQLCSRYRAHLSFTCVEMRNQEQPAQALSAPQQLLAQVRVSAAEQGVTVNGENALARWDQAAFDMIRANACATRLALTEVGQAGASCQVLHRVPPMGALTYLRLGPKLLEERSFARFMAFVAAMKAGPTEGEAGDPAQGRRAQDLVSW